MTKSAEWGNSDWFTDRNSLIHAAICCEQGEREHGTEWARAYWRLTRRDFIVDKGYTPEDFSELSAEALEEMAQMKEDMEGATRGK